MKIKFFLFSFALLTSFSLSAENYFVTPEGAGEKDGTTWENALSHEQVRTNASTLFADGDNLYYAEGTYYYQELPPAQ